MSESGTVVLEATDVRYFSEFDEAAFFEWLGKLACVESVVGRLRTLYITVNPEAVDDAAMHEFVGVFRRYNVALGQLRALDSDRIGPWFRNPQGAWYQEIFGSAAVS